MTLANQIIVQPQAAGESKRRRRMYVSFWAAVAVLLVAAVGLNWSVATLRLHFKKEAVPMRLPFSDADSIPAVLGNWVRVMEDELDEEVVKALGAYREKGRDKDDYLFCSYMNATAVGKKVDDLKKEFAELPYDKKRQRVLEYGRQYPAAVVRVGLSYYTGKADTVAHIPERCFVAEGYDPLNPSTEKWDLGGRSLEVRSIGFSDQRDRTAGAMCNVAYVFHVNGKFMSDSLAVRRSLQNLFAKYAYYAKVELRSDNTTREASANAMRDLLTVLLPEVEKALPDWDEYTNKNEPGRP